MVLALFSVIFILTFASSWQQEATEKNLNEMLDQLIEETVLTTFSEENENNSRIIYVNPDNMARHDQETKLNVIHSNEYEDLDNLVHQIANSKLKVEESDKNKVIQELNVDTDRIDEFNNDLSDSEVMHTLNIINNGFSKSGRPLFEDISDSATIIFTPESESSLIHKYPEIIIDKITKDASTNEIEERSENPDATHANKVSVQNNGHTDVNNIMEVPKEVAAKAFDSLMKILMKGKPKKSPIDTSNAYLAKDDMNALIRSTHVHNAFHNHVVNNVPLGYGRKILLEKLPQDYHNLHRIIPRHRSAYLDPNLQLNRWEGNLGHNSMVGISRIHNLNHLNRARFIPKPLNIIPRIVYQPFYHHRHHFL